MFPYAVYAFTSLNVYSAEFSLKNNYFLVKCYFISVTQYNMDGKLHNIKRKLGTCNDLCVYVMM